jgi:ribose 5-phosphate isomerase A
MIAEHALSLLGDARIVGLGSGRAAERFIRALAKHGARVSCVPTSEATAQLAASLGLQLVAARPVDVTFDGADEVDPQLALIKGYGGALLREKIVASASKRLVIMVSQEKLVSRLGARGRLPIEVVPFAVPLVMKALWALEPALRTVEGQTFVSDNGNHIVDCVPNGALTPDDDRALRELPGVVATGLFFELATTVLVERPDGVQVMTRTP